MAQQVQVPAAKPEPWSSNPWLKERSDSCKLSLDLYMCTAAHVQSHTHMHTCAPSYTHAHTCALIHTCTHVHRHTHRQPSHTNKKAKYNLKVLKTHYDLLNLPAYQQITTHNLKIVVYTYSSPQLVHSCRTALSLLFLPWIKSLTLKNTIFQFESCF